MLWVWFLSLFHRFSLAWRFSRVFSFVRFGCFVSLCLWCVGRSVRAPLCALRLGLGGLSVVRAVVRGAGRGARGRAQLGWSLARPVCAPRAPWWSPRVACFGPRCGSVPGFGCAVTRAGGGWSGGARVTAPVGFSGSRTLSPAAASVAGAVARGVVASGALGLVGCAAGADAVLMSAFVGAGAAARLSVFAAFGPGGAGAAGRASAVSGVEAAAAAGASVAWWAGGPVSVPVQARLARRSLAFVRALASSGGRLLVFPSALPPRALGAGAWPSCGSGSWSSACAAARLGVAVVVVPAFAGPLPLLGPGAWAPVSVAGAPAWRWAPPVGLFD